MYERPRKPSPSWVRAVVALGASVALLATACSSPEEKLAQHFQRGLGHAESGDLRAAIIEFQNALAIDPNRADVHWALALAFRDAGDPRQALWELQETVRLDPSHTEARVILSYTLSLGSDPDALAESLRLADEVIGEEPRHAAARLSRGRALQRLGRLDEAKEAFRAAAERGPDSGEPLRRIAEVERMLGRPDEAEALYRRAVEVDPGFASSINLAVFLSTRPGRDAEAEAAYREAIEKAQGALRVQARGVTAGFLYSRGRFEDAEMVLRDGLTETEWNSPRLVITLAQLVERATDAQEADRVLQEAARWQAGKVAPLLTLSVYRSGRGDLEGAMKAVDEAAEIDPTDPRVRLRRGLLMSELGMRASDEAAVAEGDLLIDEVIESGAVNAGEALLVRGRLELARGTATDETLHDLRRAIDLGADPVEAHTLLGAALFARQDLAGSRTELARAVAYDPTRAEAQGLLARVHAALGESELAVDVGRRVLAARPGDSALRLALAQSLVDEGRIGDASELMSAVVAEERDFGVHFAAARIHMLAGDVAAARAGYEAAARIEPHRAELLAALMELDAREGRLEESATRLSAAVQARPNDADLARLQGRLALVQGDDQAALQSFERAIELDPNTMSAYADVANLLVRRGDRQAALRTYERALQNDPENGRLNLTLGMLYESMGRGPEAMRRYEVAVRVDPTLAVAKNNLAYLLVESGGDLDRALSLARDAKAALPTEPSVADTLGWVLLKKGLTEPAIVYLREGERGTAPGDPLGPLIRSHLALAYEANGEPARAIELFERVLQEVGEGDAPEPPWATEARVSLDRLRGA